jgi:hypothetical protein
VKYRSFNLTEETASLSRVRVLDLGWIHMSTQILGAERLRDMAGAELGSFVSTLLSAGKCLKTVRMQYRQR